MSLARAFTSRRSKQNVLAAEADSRPHRSNSTKAFGSKSVRSMISGPIELVHTTNMLSYNAPDLFPKLATSTTSTPTIDEDSLSDSTNTNHSTPPTSPDIVKSPKESSADVKPNHLSCYFSPPGEAAPPAKTSSTSMVQQRAPSHRIKSFDTPTRQGSVARFSEQSNRSVSTKNSLNFSRASSSSTSTLATSVSHTPHLVRKVSSASEGTSVRPSSSTGTAASQRQDHSPVQRQPLGPELAQVREIVEEYGVKDRLSLLDREEQELASKGLVKLSADDYLREVQGLFRSFFTDVRPTMPTAVWI